MRIFVGAIGLLVAVGVGARPARADCIYHNDYYSPGYTGTCGAETRVPEGCPVHVATTAGHLPIPQVVRGDATLTLPATTTTVDTLDRTLDLVDVYDCACTASPGVVSFDLDEVTLAGSLAGDVVVFDQGTLETETIVVIDPAGPCPDAVWPTVYDVATRCDMCPPVDGGDDGDDDGSGGDDTGSGGCSTAPGDRGGALAFGVALAFAMTVARRRRNR